MRLRVLTVRMSNNLCMIGTGFGWAPSMNRGANVKRIVIVVEMAVLFTSQFPPTQIKTQAIQCKFPHINVVVPG